MSVPKFKRQQSEYDYVNNAYELNVEIMNLVSKLSARWARIYQQPIDRLANLQADLVNMACSITPKASEDFITRRWLLKMSNACLTTLERRIMEMIRILYANPSKCFNRRNGKNYTFAEATEMLDKKLENLGIKYARQYDLIKGVLAADKKKMEKQKTDNITDKEIIEILVSKTIAMVLE